MWAFLLIVALVPIIFFWSDAVHELFPALEPYLPDRNKPVAEVVIPAGHDSEGNVIAAAGTPGQWYVSESDTGFVAWIISDDSTYRLAVGCRPDVAAALQVTQLNGSPMGRGLNLNFLHGMLPLQAGVYAGEDLVNATAQFKTVHLQNQGGEVLAQFQANGIESNGVARQLNSLCTL